MRAIAIRSLARMYRPAEGLFVFHLRKTPEGAVVAEGLSRRYTAITLIGLAGEAPEAISSVLGGHDIRAVCGGLVSDVARETNLGNVALTLWAGHAVGDPDRGRAVSRILELHPDQQVYPTVEVAWVLAALSLDREAAASDLRDRVARRLIASFNKEAGIFPHVLGASGGLRGHVACFADLVYPIHALSLYHRATGDPEALAAAKRCAEQICRVQGPAGQWWWHYDYRTGRVIEGYPVYAVHQDAMAPLALFAVEETSGEDFSRATRRGLDWLVRSPELDGASLIDEGADVIWRKVARHEPGKLARALQAVASRVHPSLRTPGVDLLFRPGWIDHETRPYHMGWLLYAFPPARADW